MNSEYSIKTAMELSSLPVSKTRSGGNSFVSSKGKFMGEYSRLDSCKSLLGIHLEKWVSVKYWYVMI